jgi:TonB-linked SusC/RagA family outer membrane protein
MMKKHTFQRFRESLPKAVLTSLLMLSTTFAFAQSRVISGTVVDASGEPVIGASVLAQGVLRGVSTDSEGAFRLSVDNSVSSLEVSFIGYEPAVVDIQGRNVVQVTLNESTEEIEAVVAIGYARIPKSSVTAAISKVTSEAIQERPVTNVASALQGQLAGVEIRSTSGDPGADVQIRVRGAASVNAKSDPLYVVDGIPVDNLQALNPSDIESIEVLKDASSSAIYGSRGANGVVLVTTKRGRLGRPVVTFSGTFGIQTIEKKLDLLSSEEWIDWASEIIDRAYVTNATFAARGAQVTDTYDQRMAIVGGFNAGYIKDPRWEDPNHEGLAYIDWVDEFYTPAKFQDYMLAVSGATEGTTYRVSANYLNREGLATNTGIERINLRALVETKVQDWLTVGLNVAPSVSWQRGYGLVEGKDSRAHTVNSIVPVAEADAGIYTNSEPYAAYAWAGGAVSPVAYLEQVTSDYRSTYIQSSAFARAEIFKGLTAEITGAWNYTANEHQRFIPSSVITGASSWASTAEGYGSTARHSFSNRHFMMGQGLLNYNVVLGKHTLTAMAGYSAEKTKASENNIETGRFGNNAIHSFDQANTTITRASSALRTDVTLLSYFGRVTYDFDGKYLLNASVRRDGSSLFGTNKKWGTFPAASVAWRVSAEDFYPKDFFMNSVKLRLSYGVNGNNSVPTSAAIGILESANYPVGTIWTSGYRPRSTPNVNLGWEKTYSWDIAADLGFLHDRITLTLDYYKKNTKDMLYNLTVPSVLGYTSAMQNVGEIENRGFEVELVSRNIVGRDFSWTTNFNLGYNKNKVISLGENDIIFTGSGSTQLLEVGKPLYQFYLYDAIGVYMNAEDLANSPKMSSNIVGDVKYRDVNGNGEIDAEDKTTLGSPFPKFTYGLNNAFSYKNFDFNILLTAQTGGMIYGLLGRAIDNTNMGRGTNPLGRWRNRWRSEEDPGDGHTPRSNGTTSGLYDSRWLYSSDFIKIKNISIGYNIPIRKFAQSARVYFSCENVYMWDKYYGGYSPETLNSNASSTNGIAGQYDYGAYPHARTFTLGLNLTF